MPMASNSQVFILMCKVANAFVACNDFELYNEICLQNVRLCFIKQSMYVFRGVNKLVFVDPAATSSI